MYKLICIDMDATFLDDNKGVSERNLKAVRAAHENGVKVAVCTGRLFTSANFYADLIGIKVPVISSNGGYIIEKDKNKVIYKEALGIENCRIMLHTLKKYGIYPQFNTSEHIITEKIINSAAAYTKYNETLPPERQIKIVITDDWEATFDKYKDDIIKCIGTEDDSEKLKKVKEELSAYDKMEVVSSFHNNVEAMKKGVSKGKAVKILADYYNIKSDEVMCIGDNENDLSMIKYAGLGVAMGNAEEILKKSADYITDTNNNDGVAKAIERFIL